MQSKRVGLSETHKANGIQQLLPRKLVLLLQPSLLYYHCVKLELLLRAFYHLLLNCVLGHQSEHLNWAFLTDSLE